MQGTEQKTTETRRQPDLSQEQTITDVIVADLESKCNLYRGKRTSGGAIVTVQYGDMPEVELSPPIDVYPREFNWGHSGIGFGQGQLALAILAHEYDERTARYFYQDFKWEVINRLPKDGWTLSSEQIAATMLEISRELAGSQLVVA